MMRRVDFDFIQSSRYLELLTVLDRSSGFFAEVWNNIGDYSKTLLSQNQLKIEYKVYIPAHLELEIENKFGDVYITEYAGKLRITLAHGNLRSNKLSEIDLDLSFGNADIKNVKDATMMLKGTECTFGTIGNGHITSSSSEIDLDQITFLKLDSRSDRRVMVEHAEEIQGSGRFSKIVLGSIRDVLRLDLDYGEIKLGPLDSFNSITLTGKNTPIVTTFSSGTSFDLSIEGMEDKIQLPTGLGLKRMYVNEKDNQVRLTGSVGKTPSGNVKIVSENGDVEILVQK